jgi:hypothetical protein
VGQPPQPKDVRSRSFAGGSSLHVAGWQTATSLLSAPTAWVSRSFCTVIKHISCGHSPLPRPPNIASINIPANQLWLCCGDRAREANKPLEATGLSRCGAPEIGCGGLDLNQGSRGPQSGRRKGTTSLNSPAAAPKKPMILGDRLHPRPGEGGGRGAWHPGGDPHGKLGVRFRDGIASAGPTAELERSGLEQR